MQNDYTGYDVEQLLNDDYFIEWLLSPNVDNEKFWTELRKKEPVLKEKIDEARSFVKHLQQDIKLPDFTLEDETNLWYLINTRNNESKKRKKSYHLFRIATGVAAMVCLCFWGAREFYLKDKQEINYFAIIESIESANGSSKEVELVLSDDKKIAISEKESQVEYSQEGDINVNSRKVADVIKKKEHTKTLNQLIVPYGKRSSITFSDGTRIWVNSGSKVVYPAVFGKEKREIFIEGEVYLDVMHDEKWPFIVKTQQMDVRVLGTSFNVSAYKDEPNLQVTLVEGKVKVNTNNNHSGVLSPNQQFTYNSRTDEASVQTVDVNSYIAWKSGYYQFTKQPLNIVFQKLSRYYGIQIEWDEVVGELVCSGKLDFKDDLNEVLSNLENAAPIQVTYNGEYIKISVIP